MQVEDAPLGSMGVVLFGSLGVDDVGRNRAIQLATRNLFETLVQLGFPINGVNGIGNEASE